MKWEKQFGEQVNDEFVYLMSIERVLHMEDFMEVWMELLDLFVLVSNVL